MYLRPEKPLCHLFCVVRYSVNVLTTSTAAHTWGQENTCLCHPELCIVRYSVHVLTTSIIRAHTWDKKQQQQPLFHPKWCYQMLCTCINNQYSKGIDFEAENLQSHLEVCVVKYSIHVLATSITSVCTWDQKNLCVFKKCVLSDIVYMY